MQVDHDHFMDRAIALGRQSLAEGNGPAGCLILADGQVVGEGRNCVNTSFDPTAHAELLAIRDAATRRSATALAGCTLYTSIEPCPMCCWAILNAQISTLVLGARLAPFRRRDLGTYSVEALVAMTGRKLEIITGVRERACEDLQYEALELNVRARRRVHHAGGQSEPGVTPAHEKETQVGSLPDRVRGYAYSVRNAFAAWLRRSRQP